MREVQYSEFLIKNIKELMNEIYQFFPHPFFKGDIENIDDFTKNINLDFTEIKKILKEYETIMHIINVMAYSLCKSSEARYSTEEIIESKLNELKDLLKKLDFHDSYNYKGDEAKKISESFISDVNMNEILEYVQNPYDLTIEDYFDSLLCKINLGYLHGYLHSLKRFNEIRIFIFKTGFKCALITLTNVLFKNIGSEIINALIFEFFRPLECLIADLEKIIKYEKAMKKKDFYKVLNGYAFRSS